MKTIDKYLNAENEFFENIQTKFGKSLLLYCLTGSLARKEIIPGWSDIDIMLVFDKYESAMFQQLNNLVEDIKLRYSIKVGITFYSLHEFNSMRFQDPKTYLAMHFINKGMLIPKIKDIKIIIENIEDELLKTVSIAEMTKQLHAMKRDLMNYSIESEKKIYKCMVTIIKNILTIKGELPLGYLDAFEKIQEYYSNDFKEIILPEDILGDPGKSEERKKYYVNFLNWLNNNNNALLS